jgi:hypothetical protein
MNAAEALKIITIFNAWRRAEGEWVEKTIAELPFTPRQLGEALDRARLALACQVPPTST